jgi:hypothetical protein
MSTILPPSQKSATRKSRNFAAHDQWCCIVYIGFMFWSLVASLHDFVWNFACFLQLVVREDDFIFDTAWWVIFVQCAMWEDDFNLTPLTMICYICGCWWTCACSSPAHVIKTLYLRILSLEYVGYRFKLRYKMIVLNTKADELWLILIQ